MFVVEVGAAATTIFFVRDIVRTWRHRPASTLPSRRGCGSRCSSRTSPRRSPKGRGKAQAETLRRTKSDTYARLLHDDGTEERVTSTSLRKGDRFVVEAGEIVPADGDVIEGAATVDESAITGESAPVIRESGGDRSAVTGGTRVLSDRIVVRVTANPGESFLDRMIRLVEGAQRQKTPNEIALSILLAGLDDHLSDRGRDAGAVFALCRHASKRDRPHRAARVPDPDDDRRPALGDRHRRAWIA